MWQPIEERLYLLDLGMIGEVGTGMRELLILLLTAFWQKDADLLTEVLLMLSGVTDQSALDMEAFRRQIHSLMANSRGASVKNIQLAAVLQEMIATSFHHGVPLPASLTLAAKALAQMQLVAAQLDPEIEPFDVAGRFLMGSILRRMVIKSDPKTLFYQSQKLKVRATRIFEAIERLVGARPGQRLSVDVHVASLEETVRRAGRRLGLAFIAGSAILASALTVLSDRVQGWVPVALGVAGIALIVALVVDLLYSRESLGRVT
jgi:predicted unusual protein kinase regulating ubiquinone biosynthesis (AarF/ABC1/UbiB family)